MCRSAVPSPPTSHVQSGRLPATTTQTTPIGSQIAAHFVDLPVWEASPVVRLHQVSYSFLAHQETGRGVSASRLAAMSGFAPATFHALGSRVAVTERRSYEERLVHLADHDPLTGGVELLDDAQADVMQAAHDHRTGHARIVRAGCAGVITALFPARIGPVQKPPMPHPGSASWSAWCGRRAGP